MSESRSKRDLAQPGRRHPLLLQRRLSEEVFWPCLLIVATTAALTIWTPANLGAYRILLPVILVGTGLVLVLTLAYRLTAYVQCRANGLRMQLPFYRLTIPYEQIRATRPTDLFRLFPPRRLPWFQRRFAETLLGETVVVLELARFPQPRFWLRLWMSGFMICPDTVGLVLAVPDWIAFRTELDEFRTQYRTRHH
jgi:hypothetical protein